MTPQFQLLGSGDRLAITSKFKQLARWWKTAPEIILKTPRPRYLAGALPTSQLGSFRELTLKAEEAGCLVLQGAHVYDCGLVIKDDILLLDKTLTVPPEELGAWGWYTRVERRGDGAFDLREPVLHQEKLGRAVVLLRRGYNVHGHWLLEVMPRALAALKLMGNKDSSFIIAKDAPDYHVEMLEALGVPRHKLFRLASGEAVWCDELWIPSVPHANQLWVHPFANETFNALIRYLGGNLDQSWENGRIFVTRASRARDPRPLLNCAQLEEIAKALGYIVVDPGAMPWREQIRLFSQASKVVGLCGSGLHNTVFTGRNAHVCVLQPNQNFNYLQTSIAAIRGHEISYLLGESFSAFDRRAWEASYIIDPLLFRVFLERLL